jgi:hypothetical protein
MSGELRDKFYGIPIEEWIARVPAELEIDAVGLWQVVSFGREGFGLSDEPLTDYVRRSILALLAKGAKPVRGVTIGSRGWRVVDYGEKPEDIADAIIREWRLAGQDPTHGDLWFALPHIYDPT